MRIPTTLMLVSALLGAGTSLRAQSLAEAAQKEAERRKTIKNGSDKVITNKDLKEVPHESTPPAEPAATADAKATPDAAATPASDTAKAAPVKIPDEPGAKSEVKDEKYWRAKMKQSLDMAEQDKTLLEAVQSRVNALTSDFISRDDPAQRAQIGVDRQKAMAELERLKQAVEADTKAVDALQEEARRAGVPPGWLR